MAVSLPLIHVLPHFDTRQSARQFVEPVSNMIMIASRSLIMVPVTLYIEQEPL